jgi:hypothetical protein
MARYSMTYVELHRTFMSRSRFTGDNLLRTCAALNASLRCDDERAYIPTRASKHLGSSIGDRMHLDTNSLDDPNLILHWRRNVIRVAVIVPRFAVCGYDGLSCKVDDVS